MAPAPNAQGFVPVDGEMSNATYEAHVPNQDSSSLGTAGSRMTHMSDASPQDEQRKQQKATASQTISRQLQDMPKSHHNKHLRNLYSSFDARSSSGRPSPSFSQSHGRRDAAQAAHRDGSYANNHSRHSDANTDKQGGYIHRDGKSDHEIKQRENPKNGQGNGGAIADGQADGQVDGQVDGQADGQAEPMDQSADGMADGRADGQADNGSQNSLSIPTTHQRDTQEATSQAMEQEGKIRPAPILQELCSPYVGKRESPPFGDQQSRRQSWNAMGSNAWEQALDDIRSILPSIARPLQGSNDTQRSQWEAKNVTTTLEEASASPCRTKEASTSLGISENVQMPGMISDGEVPFALPSVSSNESKFTELPRLSREVPTTTESMSKPSTKAPSEMPATEAPTSMPSDSAPAQTPSTKALENQTPTTSAPQPTSTPVATTAREKSPSRLSHSDTGDQPPTKRARTALSSSHRPTMRTTSAPQGPSMSIATSQSNYDIRPGFAEFPSDAVNVTPVKLSKSMAFPTEGPPQVPILNWDSDKSPPISPLIRTAEAEDPIHLLSASALALGKDSRSTAVRDELLQYAHYLYSTSATAAMDMENHHSRHSLPQSESQATQSHAPEATRAWTRKGCALHPTLLPLLHAMHDLHPDHLPTLLLLSCSYYTTGNLAASLWYNNQILKLNPHYVEAMSNIGTALRALGFVSEAETWWWRALQLLPGYWDAFENLLGVLRAPTSNNQASDESQTNERSPQFETALRLCEYVEAHIIPARRLLKKSAFISSIDHRDWHEAQFFPSQLSLTQIPRVQNLFYAKGNLKYVLESHGVASAAEEYQRAVEMLFTLPGRPGYTVRDVLVAICVVSILSFGAVVPGTDALTTAAEVASAFGIDLTNPAHSAVVTQGQYTRLRPDGILGLVREAGDTAVAKLLSIGGNQLPLVFLLPDQVALLLRILFAPTHGVLPVISSTVAAQKARSSRRSKSNAMDGVAQQASQIGSTILLALAKLFQDAATDARNGASWRLTMRGIPPSISLLLPFYYLALSLSPNASMFNNLGILLSSLPVATTTVGLNGERVQLTGQLLAIRYYAQGLQLDPQHSHLFTNLGSLFKDMGRLNEAIKMYEKATEINPAFDVALANLGNAIKDQGRTQSSIPYYRRAVQANPQFPEALCGLVNSLLAVCDWGDVYSDALVSRPTNENGWMKEVTQIVARQLSQGAKYGRGVFSTHSSLEGWVDTILKALGDNRQEERDRWMHKLRPFFVGLDKEKEMHPPTSLPEFVNEGGFMLRLIERMMRRTQHRWYHDLYTRQSVAEGNTEDYARIKLPSCLNLPNIPTVLPFHTFTYPLTPRQVRLISHRNALRTSFSVLSQMWLPQHVYAPPRPVEQCNGRLHIGYVSSDFNNHPLAHLMQSVFGFHNNKEISVYCYATTPSDQSPYRQKIETEAEHFIDVSTMPTEKVLQQIKQDNIHILINLNGYTKGARNDIFAARACPVQMQFMGFAGEMAASWIDWLVVDPIVCPPSMTSTCRWRERKFDAEQQTFEQHTTDLGADIDPEEESGDWVYTERFIYMPHSYFVNDHAQGFKDPVEERRIQSVHEEKGMPLQGEEKQAKVQEDRARQASHSDSDKKQTTVQHSDKSNSLDHSCDEQKPTQSPTDEQVWEREESRRWRMRKEVFPNLPEDYVIFADFNQLYKTDPNLFKAWLQILQRVPNSILWLLRFPASGESHLHKFAEEHAGRDVARRVVFTDVAPKHIHIYRGRVADLFLDTNECNAHTTAADILWSGTPLLTWPKYIYKMCSRVAASILHAAGIDSQLVVHSEQQYIDRAVELALSVNYKYEEVTIGNDGHITRKQVPQTSKSVPPNELTDEMLEVHCTEKTVLGTMEHSSDSSYATQPTLLRRGTGELLDLRRKLFLTRDQRNKCPLFDTRAWTRSLEAGYKEAWRRWVQGTDTEDTKQWQQLPQLAPEKLSSHIWLNDQLS